MPLNKKGARIMQYLQRILHLIVLPVTMLCAGCEKHAKDDKLIKVLEEHFGTFSQLRNMMVVDRGKVTRIHVDEKEPGWGAQIGSDRYKEYQSLMRQCGVTLLMGGEGGPDSVLFTVSATGMLDVGIYKGYAYSENALSPNLVNLDSGCSAVESDRRHCIAYRLIRPKWYLFVQEFN